MLRSIDLGYFQLNKTSLNSLLQNFVHWCVACEVCSGSQYVHSSFFLLSLAGGGQGKSSTKPIYWCGCPRVSILVSDALEGFAISGLDLCFLEG